MQMRRRLRWLAAALLLASPAVGGQVLPLLHPCEAQQEHAHGSHGGHQSADPSDAQCTCIGSCATPPALSAPVAQVVASSAPVRPATASPVRPATVEPAPAPPLRYLPPPTAPPHA